MKFIKSCIEFFFEEVALAFMFSLACAILLGIWYGLDPHLLDGVNAFKQKPVSPLSTKQLVIMGIPGALFYIYLVFYVIKHSKTDSL